MYTFCMKKDLQKVVLSQYVAFSQAMTLSEVKKIFSSELRFQ